MFCCFFLLYMHIHTTHCNVNVFLIPPVSDGKVVYSCCPQSDNDSRVATLRAVLNNVQSILVHLSGINRLYGFCLEAYLIIILQD